MDGMAWHVLSSAFSPHPQHLIHKQERSLAQGSSQAVWGGTANSLNACPCVVAPIGDVCVCILFHLPIYVQVEKMCSLFPERSSGLLQE